MIIDCEICSHKKVCMYEHTLKNVSKDVEEYIEERKHKLDAFFTDFKFKCEYFIKEEN